MERYEFLKKVRAFCEKEYAMKVGMNTSLYVFEGGDRDEKAIFIERFLNAFPTGESVVEFMRRADENAMNMRLETIGDLINMRLDYTGELYEVSEVWRSSYCEDEGFLVSLYFVMDEDGWFSSFSVESSEKMNVDPPTNPDWKRIVREADYRVVECFINRFGEVHSVPLNQVIKVDWFQCLKEFDQFVRVNNVGDIRNPSAEFLCKKEG